MVTWVYLPTFVLLFLGGNVITLIPYVYPITISLLSVNERGIERERENEEHTAVM